MTKADIKGLIGLIILIGILIILPPYNPAQAPLKPTINQVHCDDFPPVDGAGRPAICDEPRQR